MYRVLLVVLILVFSFSLAEGLEFEVPDLQLESKASLLMEYTTGEILYEMNIHEPLPPASLTKIMTLLLLVEALDRKEISYDDQVVISANAAEMGGSEIWLEQGEEFLLEDLIKAVAISSANDASLALAEHLFGSERLFVQAMNQRVEELGLKNSFFGNSSGLPLPDEESLVSAHDIAIIARALLEYPQVLTWTSVWLDSLRDGETELNNTNRLVVDYEGADGLKTGWTKEAGFCLVATAKRKGIRLISVILHSETSELRFKEASELLSFGFGLLRPFVVVKEEEYIKDVEVYRGEERRVGLIAAQELTVPVPRGREEDLVEEIRIYPSIVAPVEYREKLGEMLLYREDLLLGRVDLLAEREVKKAGFMSLFKEILKGVINF